MPMPVPVASIKVLREPGCKIGVYGGEVARETLLLTNAKLLDALAKLWCVADAA